MWSDNDKNEGDKRASGNRDFWGWQNCSAARAAGANNPLCATGLIYKDSGEFS